MKHKIKCSPASAVKENRRRTFTARRRPAIIETKAYLSPHQHVEQTAISLQLILLDIFTLGPHIADKPVTISIRLHTSYECTIQRINH
ncbi:conserved hypothetical protein [Trichinella spiralis]|uniref:hypothetical protein n=1 Tax=Trichinella spiralis TaxID=6334 RepID=UPI0001EFB791|nr:conserved hypothetical protein [Trichinella spiralis]